VDWLRMRYAVDRARFDRLLGDAPFFHGAAPGIGDCAIWGYVQWVDEAGVEPTPAMLGWQVRMRALPGMRTAEEFFPVAQ
jgi:glutathione S-transferase